MQTQERTSAFMRQMNDLMCKELDGTPDPVAFFCECSREGCYEPVWLTLAQYRRIRREPDTVILLPGHRATEKMVASAEQVTARRSSKERRATALAA